MSIAGNNSGGCFREFCPKSVIICKAPEKSALFKEIRLQFCAGNARIKAISKSYMGKDTTK